MKGKREKERGKSEEEMNGKESKLCLNSLAYQACKLLFYIDLHVTFVCLFVCLFVVVFVVVVLFLFIFYCLRLSAAAREAASQLYALTQLINQVKKSLSMEPMSLKIGFKNSRAPA